MTIVAGPPGPRQPRRWPFALLLLAGLTWIGLLAGTAAGVRWFVTLGSGLAGPAIAFGYGVLGAGAGLLLGALLAWKAPHGLLRALSLGSVLLGLVGAGLVGWGFVRKEAERRAAAGLDRALPPAAGFRLESRIAATEDMRRYRELTVDGDTWTATWVAGGPGAATCTAMLAFPEADGLLRKRDEVASDPDRFTSLCPPAPGAATHVYALRESDPGRPSWEVAFDAGCLQESPEIAELHWLLGRIPMAAVDDGRAECGG
jgi:Flp pilus assembly protein protease CpaA